MYVDTSNESIDKGSVLIQNVEALADDDETGKGAAVKSTSDTPYSGTDANGNPVTIHVITTSCDGEGHIPCQPGVSHIVVPTGTIRC